MFVGSCKYIDFACFRITNTFHKTVKLRVNLRIIHARLPSWPAGLFAVEKMVDQYFGHVEAVDHLMGAHEAVQVSDMQELGLVLKFSDMFESMDQPFFVHPVKLVNTSSVLIHEPLQPLFHLGRIDAVKLGAAQEGGEGSILFFLTCAESTGAGSF